MGVGLGNALLFLLSWSGFIWAVLWYLWIDVYRERKRAEMGGEELGGG